MIFFLIFKKLDVNFAFGCIFSFWSRNNFSHSEDVNIIRFLLEEERYKRVNGVKMWKLMEGLKVSDQLFPVLFPFNTLTFERLQTYLINFCILHICTFFNMAVLPIVNNCICWGKNVGILTLTEFCCELIKVNIFKLYLYMHFCSPCIVYAC